MSIKKSIKVATDSLPRVNVTFGSTEMADLQHRLDFVTAKGDYLINNNVTTEVNTLMVTRGVIRQAQLAHKQAQKQAKMRIKAARTAKKRMVDFVKKENRRLATFLTTEDGKALYLEKKHDSDARMYSLIKEVYVDLMPFGFTDICRRIMTLPEDATPEQYRKTFQRGMSDLIKQNSDVFTSVGAQRGFFEALIQKWRTEFKGENAPEIIEILANAQYEQIMAESGDQVAQRHGGRVEAQLEELKKKAEAAQAEKERTRAQRKAERDKKKGKGGLFRRSNNDQPSVPDTAGPVDSSQEDNTTPVILDDDDTSPPKGLGQVITTGQQTVPVG